MIVVPVIAMIIAATAMTVGNTIIVAEAITKQEYKKADRFRSAFLHGQSRRISDAIRDADGDDGV